MTQQEDDQNKEFDFQVVDEKTLKEEKEKYAREVKLHEMFADAPDELKNIVEEAKKEPMDDLIYDPEAAESETDSQ